VFPAQIEELAVKKGYVDECVVFSYIDNGKPKIVLQTEIELDEYTKEKIKHEIKIELSHWSVPSVFYVAPIPRTELGKIDFVKAKENFCK